MPRRLVQDSYRGWHGWESRLQSTISMTQGTAYSQRAKNDLIKFEHSRYIEKLERTERHIKERQQKASRNTQIDLVKMKAYGIALSQYSFTQSEKDAGKLSGTSFRREDSCSTVPRTVKFRESPTDISKIRPITTGAPMILRNKEQRKSANLRVARDLERGNTLSKKAEMSIGNDSTNISNDQQQNSTSTDSSHDLANEADLHTRVFMTEEEDDDDSSSEIYDLSDMNKHNGNGMKSASVPMISTSTETLEEKRAQCAETNAWKLALFKSFPTFPSSSNRLKVEEAPQYDTPYRRKLKTSQGLKLWETPMSKGDRISQVFPANCRSVFTLRKMVEEKAGKLIKDWSPDNARKSKARLILERMKQPTVVRRQKTTSAIMRDYRRYKSHNRSLDDYPKLVLNDKQTIVY